MLSAQLEQRNTIGPAISSGVATLPRGIVLPIEAVAVSSANTSAVMSVTTQPGATEFTFMPDGASSDDSDLVNAI
jgi:hypothetical protein